MYNKKSMYVAELSLSNGAEMNLSFGAQHHDITVYKIVSNAVHTS